MTPSNAIYLGVGFIAGMAVWFTQVDQPKTDSCVTYKVARKTAVSYVLQPPSQAMLCPTPIGQAKAEEPKVEEPAAEPVEEKPRRRHRRRHWRRRHW